ncbi:RNA polymerase sigma factor [Actinotalea subterranea]|uniref:RNA polymerase sigma factor n=1 Tax=Actinotalea subterranea TaxID=2607497 RepID=UPI001FE28A2B|nr:sigma-70 family RNA polymerase sigma factor [Actinotalea subterranea]
MALLNAPRDDDAAPHRPAGAAASAQAASALARAFADEWGRVVATLVRVTGDWALAEDAAQDAFASAALRWERDGVPDRPGAWLTTTARNAAIDRMRRDASQQRRIRDHAVLARDTGEATAPLVDVEEGDEVQDDRLRLVVTCCHPALPLDARVALTLRTLCGLTVEEIARAFGTTEAAMSKRLVRARQKIAHARIPYRVPRGPELGGRLPGVLAVLYLLFTEGYAPTGDAVVRDDLTGEAVRLTRVLAGLVPDEPEVHGLLALELLHGSRRAARATSGGDVVPLDEQDRSLWDAGLVGDGLAALGTARALGRPAGPYVLQAEIAACHATAATPAATDTGRIAVLYDELTRIQPTPHVRLARVMAVAAADGPDAGLALLPDVAGDLAGSYLLPAAEADLERRTGRLERAADAYRRALDLTPPGPARRFLERRLGEVTGVE